MDFASLGLGSFPRHSVVEDTVEYFIHVIPKSSADLGDSKAKLESLLPEILNSIREFTDDFIWQREEFSLEVIQKDGLSYLHGQLEFGESIDDEWFTVFLLREISRKFPELWIRVVDTDGEFLLIEAAHALPKWLSPEVADNRVWLSSGSLFIIPRSKEDRAAAKAGQLRSLDIKDALGFIEKSEKELIHNQLLQEEAFYRISSYPASLRNHFHHARVFVPRTVAKILHEKPKFISSIVETFCLRDPVQLKARHPFPIFQKLWIPSRPKICNTMPTFPPRDPVEMSVRFTKITYAQLKQQVFRPPRPFILPSKESPQYQASELGMKLTCGFELLVSGHSKKNEKAAAGGRLAKEAKTILEVLDSPSGLPSDEDIKNNWSHQVDSEDWLDVDYQEFEANMSGNTGGSGETGPFGPKPAFNDKEQQEKLKKMVENFEKFMNDDTAGFDGAKLREGFNSDDDDDIGDDEDDVSTDEEDRNASFDEKEFSRMMREMMGLPPESNTNTPPYGGDEMSDDDEDELSIRQTMAKMEQELVAAGALDPGRPGAAADSEGRGRGRRPRSTNNTIGKKKRIVEVDEDEDGDGEFNYEVVKNMLESLKAEGGDTGPAANMLRSMGIVMPRDDGDSDDEGTVSSHKPPIGKGKSTSSTGRGKLV